MTTPDTARSEHYLRWSNAGRASSRRYAAGTVLIVLAWAAGTLAAPTIVAAATGLDPQASAATGLAYLLSTFALAFLAVPLIVRSIHRRPGWTVALARPIGPVRDLGRGIAIALISLLAVDLLSTAWEPVTYVGLDLDRWLPLAGVALVGFAIQTGFEELFFRGYLMQSTYRFTGIPLLVVGLPALGFSAMHWGNLTQFGNNPLQLTPYLLLAVTMGWAAWRTGSLWLPFGIHWANNTYGVLLLGNQGDILPTGAPFQRDLTNLTSTQLLTLATLLCLIQVALIRMPATCRHRKGPLRPPPPQCKSLMGGRHWRQRNLPPHDAQSPAGGCRGLVRPGMRCEGKGLARPVCLCRAGGLCFERVEVGGHAVHQRGRGQGGAGAS